MLRINGGGRITSEQGSLIKNLTTLGWVSGDLKWLLCIISLVCQERQKELRAGNTGISIDFIIIGLLSIF